MHRAFISRAPDNIMLAAETTSKSSGVRSKSALRRSSDNFSALLAKTVSGLSRAPMRALPTRCLPPSDRRKGRSSGGRSSRSLRTASSTFHALSLAAKRPSPLFRNSSIRARSRRVSVCLSNPATRLSASSWGDNVVMSANFSETEGADCTVPLPDLTVPRLHHLHSPDQLPEPGSGYP